jgi:hypothetical protein
MTMNQGTKYLVIGRCGMDDIPLRLADTLEDALYLAQSVTENVITRMARKVMEVDVSHICNVSIVLFKRGIAQRSLLVKEF